MPVSAVSFLAPDGGLILHQDYRDEVPLDRVRSLSKLILSTTEPVLPCTFHEGCSVVHIKCADDVVALAVTTRNSNAVMVMSFLWQCVNALRDVLGPKQEFSHSLRNNLAASLELLDEAMDYGYPQLTAPRGLREFLVADVVREKEQHRPPTAHCGTPAVVSLGLRGDGIHHQSNEVLLDVTEQLELLCKD